MNQVVSQARLFRALALHPRTLLGFIPLFMFTSVATIVASGLTFWSQMPLVALTFLAMRPAWADYQALSLGSKTWRHHRRWLQVIALGFTLLVASTIRTATPAGDDIPLIYPALVAMSLLTVFDFTERGKRSRRRVERTAESFFPVDPVNQIIRGPQIVWWATIWTAGVAYTAIRWAIDTYMGEQNSSVFGFIFIAASCLSSCSPTDRSTPRCSCGSRSVAPAGAG